MRPCDVKSSEEANRCLDCSGLRFNNESLSVHPGLVILTIGPATLKISMKRFKTFAEWYLEDQKKQDKERRNGF